MSYKISRFQDPARIPELIDLFRTGLGETTEEHWMWRLFSDNSMPEKAFAVIAEDENGRIIGVSSVLPAEYHTGSGIYRCFQYGDWVVHPEHRGKGLIREFYNFIYEYFKDKQYDFIIEYPNDNSYPIFMKYGFTELPKIPSWRTSKKIFCTKRKKDAYTVDGVEYLFTKTCPFTETPPAEEGRMVRSPELLRWKYDENPTEIFTWLTMQKNGQLIGYFVFATTKGRFRTAINLYDWAYLDDSDMIFRTAVRLLLKNGNFVSIWGRYSDRIKTRLKRAGMKEADGGTRLVLKAVSEKGWPEPLYLTRIDTDY